MCTTIIASECERCVPTSGMPVPSVPRLFLMWNQLTEPCHRQCQQGPAAVDNATGSSVPLRTARALLQLTGDIYYLLLELISNKPGTMEPAPKTRVSTALTAFHDCWNQVEPLEPLKTTGSVCQTSISERGQASLPYRFVVGKQIYLIKCICRLLRKARTEMRSSVFLLITNYPMEVQNV